VGEGLNNIAGGDYSTVPGGVDNVATADFSFAAGRHAHVIYPAAKGTFIWCDSQDYVSGATEPDQFLIRAQGGVGIRTLFPEAQLHVTDKIDAAGYKLSAHVAAIENTAYTNNSGPDVLALKVNVVWPDASSNFITFFDSNSTIGAIEGDGSGGISFKSGSGDYAEWVPRLDPVEILEKGDIVGLFGGKATRATRGADQVMVISSRPIVVGNEPAEEEQHLFARVAFLGQVEVKVRGVVRAGDYVLASGLGDGVGTAVSPEALAPSDHPLVVGRAWQSSEEPGLKRIKIVVGLPTSVPGDDRLRSLVEQQQRTIDTLMEEKKEQQAINKELMERLQALEQKVGETREPASQAGH
jgi:hypothetical protein